MISGSSRPTPQSVVIFTSSETDASEFLARVAPVLAPFTGAIHVVRAVTPLRRVELLSDRPMDPDKERVAMVEAIDRACRVAGLDRSRVVIHGSPKRPWSGPSRMWHTRAWRRFVSW